MLGAGWLLLFGGSFPLTHLHKTVKPEVLYFPIRTSHVKGVSLLDTKGIWVLGVPVDRLPRDIGHGTAHQKLQEAAARLVAEPEPGGTREVGDGREVAVQPVD